MTYLKLVASETSPESTAYAEAIEELDAGMCVVDSDGTVLANNQAFRRLLDLPQDWVNAKAGKRPIPASEQLVSGWLARLGVEGNFSEVVALSARFCVCVVGKALPSGGASLTLTEAADESGPIADPTKQPVARWVLHDAEENFRGVVENMADVYYHSDLDGNTTFGGPAVGRLLGYEPEEFEALDWRVLHVDPDRRVKFLEELERNGGQVSDFEAAFRHKNGEAVWLSSNIRYRYGDVGELVGIEGVIRNISEQKSTQEALAKSEARLRAIIENSNAIIQLKGLDGCFQFVSKNFESAYGVVKEEAVGKTPHEVMPSEFADVAVAQDRRVVETGESIQEELVAPFADGTKHVLLVTKFPVRDDAGHIVGVGAINTDITGQVADREQLRRNEAGFRNAQQLARMGHVERNFVTGETYWSDGCYEIFDIDKRRPVPGTDELVDHVHPEDRIIFKDMLANMFAGVSSQKVDFRLISSSGEVRYVHELLEAEFDSDGNPTHCVAVIQDVSEVKLAEVALRESEQRFRSMIDNLPNAVSLKDRDHRFISVNKSFENLYGRTEESVIGEPLPSAMPDHDDWKAVMAADQEILDGERASYEGLLPLRLDDGVVRTLEMRKFPVTDVDGGITSVGTISTDITKRLEAEHLLSESEAKFHAIFEQAGLGIGVVGRDGEFLDVNNAMAEMFGLTPNEMVGDSIGSLTVEDDLERSREQFEALLNKENDVARFDKRYLRKGGEPFEAKLVSSAVFDEDDEFKFAVALIEDVTERKKSERALRESEERLRAITDHSPAAIYLKDIGGRYIFANRVWHDTYNPTGEDIVGKTVPDFVLPDTAEQAAAADAKVLETGEPIIEEQIAPGVEGSWQTMLSTKFPVRDGDGNIVAIGGVNTDITDRVVAERALRDSEEHLAHAQRIAKLGSWVWDLNTDKVTWSDALYQLMQIDPASAADPVDAFYARIHPDDRAGVEQSREKLKQAGHQELMPFRIILPSGEERIIHTQWVVEHDASGQPVRAIGITHDVTEANKAERALRESEQWFRAVVDNVPATLTLKNPDGTFRYVNKQFRDWYDIDLDEAVGRTGHDLFPDETADAVDALDQAVFETGDAVQAEVPATFADGSAHTLLTNKFLVRDDDGAVIGNGLVGYDVTESNRAELALRESEARFRALVDNLPAGVTLKGPDENVLFINELIEEWYGVSLDEVAGKRFSDVTPHSPANAATHAKMLQAQQTVIDAGKSVELEIPLTFADDSERDLQITVFPVESGDGEQINIGSVVFDVTDKKRAELARRESEERFHALVENLPAGVTLKDSDRNVLFINGKIEEWFGVSLEQVAGRKFHEVTEHSQDNAATHEKFIRAQQRAVDSGQAVEAELPLRFADGSDHEVRTIYFPVESSDGGSDYIGNIIFDVTERRRTEEMLRQALKMEAVGQLTGGVAHDFNNLLAVVIGNLEMVADDLPADTRTFEFVRNAFNAAERGASLTHHLLAFSRQQVLRPEETDLAKLIANTSELMSVSMGERINVELKADDDLWLCNVDQVQLQNAILNLSINARDAMPSGGDVTISAENAPLDAERAEALELDAGDYVCLSVSDNGPGIPADVLEHVFEPFFTTKDVGEGSGLGLSMVYGFVRQSGASVDIEVGESGGTAVKLYFPAFVPDEPEADEHSPIVQDQVTEPDATILLVEDNAAFREITRAILESLNFRVIDFGTAEEALAVIGDTTPINLLLSDIGLPGDMDGHDLAQFAATARPGLKTVLMSAHTGRDFSDGIIDGNVAAFLRKPHRKADLTQTLHRVLGIDS